MTKTADDLLECLFDTIAVVRSGAIEIDKARMINDLCQTAVNLGKAQVDHARVVQGNGSRFLAAPEPESESRPHMLPNGIVGIRRHMLKDE